MKVRGVEENAIALDQKGKSWRAKTLELSTISFHNTRW